MYVTITDLDYYMGERKLKIGQKLALKKDYDNPYDEEVLTQQATSIMILIQLVLAQFALC